jgi:hypothetical protein
VLQKNVFASDSPLEGNGFEPSVPRCARIADSAAVVWRRLIRAVSGGSSDRRPTTRNLGPAQRRRGRFRDCPSARRAPDRHLEPWMARFLPYT